MGRSEPEGLGAGRLRRLLGDPAERVKQQAPGSAGSRGLVSIADRDLVY